MSPRVAVVTSHPVQYYAPWFRFLAGTCRLDLKVFYLWNGGSTKQFDPGFGLAVQWDVPLLDGYNHEFVPNLSRQPGSGRFLGLHNPSLPARLAAFAPAAVLLIGYNAWSFLRLIFASALLRPRHRLFFRGDSHRLVSRPDTPREQVRRRLICAVYRRFAAVLYVGQANREYFRWHGVPEDRLFFSPHAVDNDRFTAAAEITRSEARLWRRSLGVPEDRLLILFAGKFENKKRPLDLLAAFERLGPQSGASLLFVGSGHLEGELRTRAAGQPNVHFAPFQNQSQMPRTYAAADLFVLPSQGGEETWGLAVNEALCLGLPVIVSDHVGCATDLVDPGRSGLIFPAGNVDALEAALREALSCPQRLVQWGEAGRTIVARHSYAAASEGLFAALAPTGSTRPRKSTV
jgi:glycosyltransferase involved in cell wall biosynthesis